MKKVALFSFFKSRNLGDILLSQMIAQLFENRFGCRVDRLDFSTMSKNLEYKQSVNQNNKSDSSPKCKARFVLIKRIGKLMLDKSARKAVRENDTVILAGGNMLMDMGKTPSYSLNAYVLVKLCKLYKKRVCICFAGAGPIENKAGRYFIRKAVNASDFISVRDEQSKEFLESIGVRKDIKIWKDIVWLYPKKTERESADMVGVNVYLSCIKSESEKNQVREALKEMTRKLSEKYKVCLFSTEKADYRDIKELINETDLSVEYINCEEDLMKLYSKVKVVLATRMHTAITAVTQEIPVVALSWQPKVQSMMKLAGLDEYVFDLDRLPDFSQEILEKIDYIYNNSEELSKLLKSNREKIAEEIENNIKAFEI